MEITVFAKKRTTEAGKPFTIYIARMTRKSTGEAVTVTVRFREECPAPKAENCPCNVQFEKTDANISSRVVTNSRGEEVTVNTLWISKWKQGKPYVDDSLDDFS